jgi:chemotaxis protein CheD
MSAPARTEIFLHPGEYFVGDASHRLATLLGSCVSVTLWHPTKRIGAMSHFVLPERSPAAATGPLDARYGREAMDLMVNELLRRGIRPEECQAKLFGGGDMFSAGGRFARVGRDNGEMARNVVRQYGASIASESLFGERHRKIIFDISTGEVWVRAAEKTEGKAW